MRTQEEINLKIAELENDIDKGIGRTDISKIQIAILQDEDDADNYEQHEDSWIHQGAEQVRNWMEGYDWDF